MSQWNDYEIREQLYESQISVVFRAARKTDRRPVVLKLLKPEGLSGERLERYQREFELLRRLALDTVPRAYALARHGEGYFLAMEDFGGESLKERIGRRRFGVEEFLDTAIRCCTALGEVHLADIIHKDINPANLVQNPLSGELKIIDFGISTLLPRLNPVLRHPESLEGTLHYIAPEQTGRMNRSLDYRADFYSLGASFHEMLAGQPPFAGDDPNELVFSHIARRPPSLTEIDAQIPAPLAAIIGKLLAKNAEDRYQSAWGIRADLQECQRQWRENGRIETFELGRRDVPHRFQVAQHLYGRQATIDQFLGTLAAGGGQRRLTLIGGYSGIGKTSLVREICKPLTVAGGRFITGKFDQFQKNTPYSALVAAFRALIEQTLACDEAELARARRAILDAVGASGAVIARVIPEIELIIGPQPVVPDLPPGEAQNRFNNLFLRFLQVFCDAERPLVIFLDDLQWADLATLKLIEAILCREEARHLLLIGAYRDNEVGANHPLRLVVARLREGGAPIDEITLAPLANEDIADLVADTLRSTPAQAAPLADLVFRKTLGNPFFINQFLKTLYREGLIEFRPGDDQDPRCGWQWDLQRIVEVGITDNVVELLVGRLRQLPAATQQALRLAACIGNSFDLETLAIICRRPAAALLEELMPALRAELIEEPPDARHAYRFLHDRVQQAAYSLIDEALRLTVHLDIGRLLRDQLSSKERQERLFEIVDHLNAGREGMIDAGERVELAELNLRAGERARLANAYPSALGYLDVAVACLPPDAWHSRYELAHAAHRERANVRYLNGEYEASMADIAEVRRHARTALE